MSETLFFAKAVLKPAPVDVVFVPQRPTKQQAEAVAKWDPAFRAVQQANGSYSVCWTLDLITANGRVVVRQPDGLLEFYHRDDFNAKYSLTT